LAPVPNSNQPYFLLYHLLFSDSAHPLQDSCQATTVFLDILRKFSVLCSGLYISALGGAPQLPKTSTCQDHQPARISQLPPIEPSTNTWRPQISDPNHSVFRRVATARGTSIKASYRCPLPVFLIAWLHPTLSDTFDVDSPTLCHSLICFFNQPTF
jgi:hypothetical protein